MMASRAGVTSHTSSVSPGRIIEPPRLRFRMMACRSVMSSMTSQNTMCGSQLIAGAGAQPGQDGLPGALHVGQPGAVPLEHAELALHVQDAGLHGGHPAQRQVGDPLDGQGRGDVDDERVLALHRRVAAGPGRGAQVRRELPLQVLDEQVHPELRRGRRHRFTRCAA